MRWVIKNVSYWHVVASNAFFISRQFSSPGIPSFSRLHQIGSYDDEHSLTILAALKTDSGSYKVAASNPHGNAHLEFAVDVGNMEEGGEASFGKSTGLSRAQMPAAPSALDATFKGKGKVKYGSVR